MRVSTQALLTSNSVCANTKFVQNALQNSYNGLLGLDNTWSAGQTFIMQALGNSSLLVATTQFVQNTLSNFLSSVNTFSLVQTFSGGINVNYTPSAAGAGSANALGYNIAQSTLPATQNLTSNVVNTGILLFKLLVYGLSH